MDGQGLVLQFRKHKKGHSRLREQHGQVNARNPERNGYLQVKIKSIEIMGSEHEQNKHCWAPALNPSHGCSYLTVPFAGVGHLGLCLKGNPILLPPPARPNKTPRQKSQ